MARRKFTREFKVSAVKLVRDNVIGKIKAVHSWQKNAGNGYTKLTAAPASGPSWHFVKQVNSGRNGGFEAVTAAGN